jgi:Tfp pilus assembly protein PilN
MLYQMIVDLEEIMPESVGIVDMSVKDGAVSITGIANGKDSLAMFMTELKNLSYVNNVHVTSILDTSTELGGVTTTFNMEWQLALKDNSDAEGSAEE